MRQAGVIYLDERRFRQRPEAKLLELRPAPRPEHQGVLRFEIYLDPKGPPDGPKHYIVQSVNMPVPGTYSCLMVRVETTAQVVQLHRIFRDAAKACQFKFEWRNCTKWPPHKLPPFAR